jgi:hypothetical protein
MSQVSLYTILNNVTTKTYVTGITIYNTQQCNHQNYVLVVTLLSIVNSDASDIGFGGYNESCQSIVYSDDWHHYIQYSDTIHCNHQNLCHRHHYIQYSTL